mmetsp:Transcript_28833/g.61717  ORF Transcript_28833/g.61717 Transcript_28833/m.61717 type:complete len:180 (+) Transcript_28833:200-739(+)
MKNTTLQRQENLTMLFLWIQSLIFLLRSVDQANSATYENVYGDSLQNCSGAGMALTGYTREGKCVDQYDDLGSHHICINLASIASTGMNFCEVTGQSDWCSSSMECHEDRSLMCPVENWCICQWTFASYIEKAGGCDKIQDINCSAVNMEAVKAYRNSGEKYADALDCLVSRCSLESFE